MISKLFNFVKKETGYEKELKEAFKRTRDWDLEVPQVKFSSSNLITETKRQQVYQFLQDNLGKLNPDYISNKCFEIHNEIKEGLEGILGVQLVYTLGYINVDRGPVFYTSIKELCRMLKYDNSQISITNKLKLHAWLTTPNYEIIDLTFMTTLALITNNPNSIGGIIFQHNTNFRGDLEYHPQLVGNDFLKKIGAMKGYITFSM